MKKIFKLMMVLAAIFLVSIKGVKAEEINVSQSFISNVWSFHYRNGSVWTFGNLPYNTIDNRLVYCIQPDARIESSNYTRYTNFTLSGYSEEEKRQMELIAYYGYGYGNNRTQEYYMATQELLWLMTPDERIKWTVGDTDDTEEIDVSREKNEILRLISTHNVFPSFASTYPELKVGEETEFIDTNNVLDNFNISVDENVEYRIEGNKLYLKPNKSGSYPVHFIRKYDNYYGSDQTYIYDDFSTRTQTLASFSKPHLENKNMIITSKVNIEIEKKDKDTNEIITNEGIKVKIKDELLDEYIGDEYEFKDGKINISLSTGKYSIEEISTVTPYSLNEEKVKFSVTRDDIANKKIEFFNEKKKCIITYITTSGNTKINAKFNIYDKNNTLVYSGETVDGRAEIELKYGDYYIKEITVPNGYILNDKEISFSVNDETCLGTLSVDNEKVTMPITSTENNIGYLIILLSNIGGYVYIKKNS